ncbi:hypothetical protein ABIE35_003470 [Paenarthrobacter sp. 4246]
MPESGLVEVSPHRTPTTAIGTLLRASRRALQQFREGYAKYIGDIP